jgi:pimeloyl-ACP methyl ester carboxylesterase
MSEPTTAFREAYAEADTEHIHYLEGGQGAPLLLLHGAFSNGDEFLRTDFGAHLANRYRIVAPDSLAHGASSAPSDPSRYSARARASQLAAVLDAADLARAHVVGYSMGGWMASALAAFHPERLASLAIGGWDVMRGMYTPAAIWGLKEITGAMLIDMARKENPDLAAWVQPEHERALALAIEGMNDLDGLAEGVAALRAPAALWCGREDLYYDAVVKFAAANDLPVLDLPGDHHSMLYQHGVEAAERVSQFVDASAQ